MHLQEQILNSTLLGQFHAGECLAAPHRFPKVGEKLINGEGQPFELLPHLVGNFIPAELHGSEVRGVSQDELVHHFRVGWGRQGVEAGKVHPRLLQQALGIFG